MKCPEVDCGGESCECRKMSMTPDQVIALLWWRFQDKISRNPGMTEEEAFIAAVWPVVREATYYVNMGIVFNSGESDVNPN